MTMRRIDHTRVIQANCGVEDSQRMLLFRTQGEPPAAIDSVICSLEAELDPTIRWRQAQLPQRGLDMAHIGAPQHPGMISISGMRQHANGLETADRKNNKASAHLETHVADAGAFDDRHGLIAP